MIPAAWKATPSTLLEFRWRSQQQQVIEDWEHASLAFPSWDFNCQLPDPTLASLPMKVQFVSAECWASRIYIKSVTACHSGILGLKHKMWGTIWLDSLLGENHSNAQKPLLQVKLTWTSDCRTQTVNELTLHTATHQITPAVLWHHSSPSLMSLKRQRWTFWIKITPPLADGLLWR